MRRYKPILRFHMPYDNNNTIRSISKISYSPLEDIVSGNHFRIVWFDLKNFYCGYSCEITYNLVSNIPFVYNLSYAYENYVLFYGRRQGY